MKHPTSQQVASIVAKFESILYMTKERMVKKRFLRSAIITYGENCRSHLDMGVGAVNNGHECGTIHCHGGWYAIAAGLHKKKIVGFNDGANKMAEDLGFGKDLFNLTDWAHSNPDLWGNVCGIHMFGNAIAFYSEGRPDGALSLQDIIDHWREVGVRLLRMELAQKAEDDRIKAKKANIYPDITEQLAVLGATTAHDMVDQPIREFVN